ncbi:hypothetical protein [Providencia huashanensis]|uniref:hypothetical protein n=1 Tax=Providencia huashanensis TaxID=3037798 RepID=UPI002B003D89|nr:hypothetical protein [Providencia sp. 23021821]
MERNEEVTLVVGEYEVTHGVLKEKTLIREPFQTIEQAKAHIKGNDFYLYPICRIEIRYS